MSFTDLNSKNKSKKILNLFSCCMIILFFLLSPFYSVTNFPVQKSPLRSLTLIWLNYLLEQLWPADLWEVAIPFFLPQGISALFSQRRFRQKVVLAVFKYQPLLPTLQDVAGIIFLVKWLCFLLRELEMKQRSGDRQSQEYPKSKGALIGGNPGAQGTGK